MCEPDGDREIEDVPGIGRACWIANEIFAEI